MIVEVITEARDQHRDGAEIDTITEFERCSLAGSRRERATAPKSEPPEETSCQSSAARPRRSVQRGRVPRSVRRRGRRPASRASSTSSPTPPRRSRSAERLGQASSRRDPAQPAGRQLGGGERGIAVQPDRVDEFRRASGGDQSTPRPSAASSSTASRALTPKGLPRTKLRETFVDNLRFAAAAAWRARHQAPDRADQHARHPGLLPDEDAAGARRHRRVGGSTCSCSTTSITCR